MDIPMLTLDPLLYRSNRFGYFNTTNKLDNQSAPTVFNTPFEDPASDLLLMGVTSD
jgi:hypothetical protein